MKNYFRILGVSHDANTEDIKNAYKRRSLLLHPDKNPKNPYATKDFNDLQEAYENLLDTEKREEHKMEVVLSDKKNKEKPLFQEQAPSRSRASTSNQEQVSSVNVGTIAAIGAGVAMVLAVGIKLFTSKSRNDN